MFDASFSFVIVLISHIVLFIRCMSVEIFSNFQVILVISRFSFILAPFFGLGALLRFSRLVWLFLYG